MDSSQHSLTPDVLEKGEHALRDDDGRKDRYLSHLDVILVFTGLFSAVVTAFIVLTISDLSANPSDETNALLRVIALQGVNATLTAADLSPPPFAPGTRSIITNCLLLASLCCALLSSFTTIREKNLVEAFGFQQTLDHPLIKLPTNWPTGTLLVGLLFFSAGLANYLWDINHQMTFVIVMFTFYGAAMFIFYAVIASKIMKRQKQKVEDVSYSAVRTVGLGRTLPDPSEETL